MKSATLTSLPNETLTTIFGYFCFHCNTDADPWEHLTESDDFLRLQESSEKSWYAVGRQPLYSSCLVSKRLRDIAQPILHHEFAPGCGDSWRSDFYSWDRRFSTFIRTLIERRDLAAAVRRIYLRLDLLDNISYEEITATVEESLDALRVSIVDYRAACQPTEFIGRSDPKYAELITLFVALPPNLDRLSIQSEYPFFVPARALRLIGVKTLPSLRTVDLVGNPPYAVNGIFEMASGLTTLHLRQYRDMGYSLWVPLAPLSIRTLTIMDSRLSKGVLRDVLASCNGDLSAFEYDAVEDGIGEDGRRLPGNAFEPLDVIQYLDKFRHTLKILRVDLRGRYGAVEPLYAPINSLKQFLALEDVSLSSNMVFTGPKRPERTALTRLLPPNIVSLHLDRVPDAVLLGLASAVSHRSFPRLRRIRCYPMQPENGFPGGELFARAKVECQIEYWTPHRRPLLFDRFKPQKAIFVPMPLPTEADSADL